MEELKSRLASEVEGLANMFRERDVRADFMFVASTIIDDATEVFRTSPFIPKIYYIVRLRMENGEIYSTSIVVTVRNEHPITWSIARVNYDYVLRVRRAKPRCVFLQNDGKWEVTKIGDRS